MKKVVLLFVGLILSILFYREAYITSLMYYHDAGVFTSYAQGPIVVGETIRGEFVAKNDNLATVKLRIDILNRMNTTHITFRLRPKGSVSWEVINTYATERMTDGLLYPFGFPPIADSKGKAYEFELVSEDGEVANAIAVDRGYHAVASQYVHEKSMLLVKEKLLSMLRDPYMWLYVGLFIVPALALIVKQRAILLAYLLLVYIYLPVDMHSNIVLYIAVAGWYIGRLSRVRARTAYIVGILCLLAIPLALLMGNTLAADRAATLVFFSLLVAGMMSL